jgi:hypothetical protein
VRAAAVHPGVIHTKLARYVDSVRIQSMIEQMTEQLAAEGKSPFQWKTLLSLPWEPVQAFPKQELAMLYRLRNSPLCRASPAVALIFSP